MPRGVPVLLAVLALTLGGAGAARASEGGDLRVDQPPSQHLGVIRAGETLTWRIGTWVEGAPSAELDLQLRAWGELVERDDDLTVEVRRCEAGSCSRTVVERAPVRQVATPTSSGTWHVASLSGEERVDVVVELSLPTGASGLEGLAGNIAVGLFAAGESGLDDDLPDDEVPDDDVPDDGTDEAPRDDEDRRDLAETGFALGGLALLALGLLGAGALVRASGRDAR